VRHDRVAAGRDLLNRASARSGLYLVLAATAASVALLGAASGPIRDVDYYWHVLVGREILAGAPIAEAGRGWSLAPVPDTWVSTQWLAEVLLAWLDQLGGASTALVYRVVTTAAVLFVLAVVTLHRRPLRPGAVVFALAALTLGIFAQERSQQLTYLLAPLVGLWAERAWREGRPPRWWVLLPVVWIWAQLHGGWVLAPALLLLAALARVVDRRGWDRTVGVLAAQALAAVAVAALAPAGVANVTAVLRFSSAAEAVQEWQRVELWSPAALPLVVLLAVLLVSWARGRTRPTIGELLYVGVLVAFAFSAYRNLPTAALALAPAVVTSLARSWGDDVIEQEPTRGPLRLGSALLVTATFVLALVTTAMTTPAGNPAKVPVALLDRISVGDRVLPTYNVSGAVLWRSGPPPDVLVAIDGRTDRYGADYIERYTALEAGLPGWESLLDELDPTVALLRTDRALAELLVTRRGWTEIDRTEDHVLLRAPD
jgi:hypothetical protein